MKIDTIVPNVDDYYVTVFDGKVNVVAFKFLQDAVFGYALIILGIYPIANDFQGKIGVTEMHILRYLNPEYFPVPKVSWIDLCPYSSLTNNSVIDQNKILKLTSNQDVIYDTFRRLEQHIECVGTVRIPCVYIGGESSQAAFNQACSLGIVSDKHSLSQQYQVSQCTIYGKRCLVLEGHAHPSAHLMSHGSSQSERELIETIFILNAMGRCALEVAELDNDTISSDHFQ